MQSFLLKESLADTKNACVKVERVANTEVTAQVYVKEVTNVENVAIAKDDETQDDETQDDETQDDEMLLKHIGGTEQDDANNVLQQLR